MTYRNIKLKLILKFYYTSWEEGKPLKLKIRKALLIVFLRDRVGREVENDKKKKI